MNSMRKDDFVKAKHFRIFVFNDKGFIMMVQKKSRLDIPHGQILPEDLDFETAARRVVFAETKTAINPIVPVALISVKEHSGNENPTLILAARINGEALIKEDEKTHHRYLEEGNFLMRAGYRNHVIRSLLGKAKHALFCEEIRIEHQETTQNGKEKYNYRSRL